MSIPLSNHIAVAGNFTLVVAYTMVVVYFLWLAFSEYREKREQYKGVSPALAFIKCPSIRLSMAIACSYFWLVNVRIGQSIPNGILAIAGNGHYLMWWTDVVAPIATVLASVLAVGCACVLLWSPLVDWLGKSYLWAKVLAIVVGLHIVGMAIAEVLSWVV